jgi:cyanate permease
MWKRAVAALMLLLVAYVASAGPAATYAYKHRQLIPIVIAIYQPVLVARSANRDVARVLDWYMTLWGASGWYLIVRLHHAQT